MHCIRRRHAFSLPSFAALSLTLLVSSLTPSLAQAREFVSIKNNSVNVRDKPNTRAPIQWELSKGYPLQVTQKQGQWLRVKDHESTLGWVHSPLTNKTPHMVVKASSANMRSGPGQNYRLVRKLDQGDILSTLQKQNGWTKVKREGGQTGWVAQNLLWGW